MLQGWVQKYYAGDFGVKLLSSGRKIRIRFQLLMVQHFKTLYTIQIPLNISYHVCVFLLIQLLYFTFSSSSERYPPPCLAPSSGWPSSSWSSVLGTTYIYGNVNSPWSTSDTPHHRVSLPAWTEVLSTATNASSIQITTTITRTMMDTDSPIRITRQIVAILLSIRWVSVIYRRSFDGDLPNQAQD